MRELKKYPNRRLYDLTESHYVTIEDVRSMILGGDSVRITDSKDGSDLTRTTLLQILAEQEAQGHEPVLTNPALEHIIRLKGQKAGPVVSRHIEQSLATTLEHADRLRAQQHDPGAPLPADRLRRALETPAKPEHAGEG